MGRSKVCNGREHWKMTRNIAFKVLGSCWCYRVMYSVHDSNAVNQTLYCSHEIARCDKGISKLAINLIGTGDRCGVPP